MTDWKDISTAPTEGQRLLLTFEMDGKRHVAFGGYDHHWTGQRWVWENPRIPIGTPPISWKPAPTPDEGTDR